jgi:hypothetical protein
MATPARAQPQKQTVPARVYLFVVADELNPAARKFTRRVFTINSRRLQLMLAHEPMHAHRLMWPDQWKMSAADPTFDFARTTLNVAGIGVPATQVTVLKTPAP